jgi:hypothetical protein
MNFLAFPLRFSSIARIFSAEGVPAFIDMGFPKHQSSEVRDFPLFTNVRLLPMNAAAQPNLTELP